MGILDVTQDSSIRGLASEAADRRSMIDGQISSARARARPFLQQQTLRNYRSQPGSFRYIGSAAGAGSTAVAKRSMMMDMRSKASSMIKSAGSAAYNSASPGSRAMWNLNKAFVKGNVKVAGAALGAANGLSKIALGANLGQVGAAAAIVAGVGYGIGSALGITGSQAAGVASTVNETMKASSKPSFGSSQLGQSTQGLLFGLHSRRTG